MGTTVEIAYYNTFALAGGESEGTWHVEESRIKGGFNNTSVDFGVKAYLVDDEYSPRVRENAMIYSGVFNAKTKVNNTNQFAINEPITKAVDVANGSIQKLYAEDTNLIIFQENKVNKALIDKDAIFTAEGSPLTASSNLVIGQVVPFSGKFGISKNPESFAVYGNRKYFADKNRSTILRLSQDGLTPISDAGMRSFFNDSLPLSDIIYGAYDERKQKYVISLKGNSIGGSTLAESLTTTVDSSGFKTLCYGEKSSGWTSFFTYDPTFGLSLKNKFYTFNNANLYEHYRKDVPRALFYDSSFADPAFVEFVFNDQPSTIKSFLTIGYEGTKGWKMESSSTDVEQAWPVLSSEAVVSSLSIPIKFLKKEGKYHGHLRNNTTITSQGQVTGLDTSGIRGYFSKVKLQYWSPSDSIASQTTKAELFAVNSDVVLSSN